MIEREKAQTTPLETSILLAENRIKTIPLFRVLDGKCNCARGANCESSGKHPVWKRFFEKATMDQAELYDLYRDGKYNVGIPTGEVNEIFTLDFDGVEGLKTLAEWRERGWIDETWEVRTASGGVHLIYQLPNVHFEIRNTVKSVARGVDVRGEHGYTVAPGSVAGKGNYEWIVSPDEVDCVFPNSEIIDLIERSLWKTKSRATFEKVNVVIDWNAMPTDDFRGRLAKLAQENKSLKSTIEGSVTHLSSSDRDWAIMKDLARAGVSDQEITDFIIFWRRQHGDKMKTDSYYTTSLAKAKSAVEDDLKEEQEARKMLEDMTQEEIVEEMKVERPTRPTVNEFPVHTFPHEFRELIQEISDAINVPQDFAAVHMLAAVSLAIGKTHQFEIKRGYTQFANLYLMLVGEPGTSKSPVMDIIFKSIEDIQAIYDKEYEKKEREHETNVMKHKQEIEIWKKSKVGARGEPPNAPTLDAPKTLLTSDATPEALAVLFQSNPRGLALKQDELSALVDGLNQYKGGKGTDRQFYLSCWANSSIRINRKRDPKPIYASKPYLVITGNVPPGTLVRLEGLKREEDGFTDRFLISYPDNQQVAEFNWNDISQRTVERFARLIAKLLAEESNVIIDGMESREVPHTVRMSDDAKFEWGEWHTHHHVERTDEAFPQHMQGVWNKMTNHLARLTLIVHMMWWEVGKAKREEVSDEHVRFGCELADYFKQNARKVYQKMEMTAEEERVETAMSWIKERGGVVSAKQAQKGRLCGCAKKADINELFSTLEDYGYGRVFEAKTKNKKTRKEFHAF